MHGVLRADGRLACITGLRGASYGGNFWPVSQRDDGLSRDITLLRALVPACHDPSGRRAAVGGLRHLDCSVGSPRGKLAELDGRTGGESWGSMAEMYETARAVYGRVARAALTAR